MSFPIVLTIVFVVIVDSLLQGLVCDAPLDLILC